MKTIAVLTDQSSGAHTAGRYALHLAKKMKANVLLFNLIPATVPQLQAACGEPEMEETADNGLAAYALQLEQELAASSFTGSRLPEISFDAGHTELVDIMTAIDGHTDIAMVVTGVPDGEELANYILGNTCNRVIDWARIPVMVVPHDTVRMNPEKIAYATTLKGEDIQSIGELGELMESFGSELMVAHLCRTQPDKEVQTKEQALQTALYRDLNCGGVYFRSIDDSQSVRDWKWLKANKPTDIMALMLRPKEEMKSFFKRGQNADVAYHITVPVIIMPKRP
ncbi:universal stress protein [Mucilaginibacter boryungensis]|uniref:Universal stress protein n=1 Tax=Mucilaginibacter boryungensis TaxID=768480 RepID=A0ABR9XNI2_9SPHI|nr:universal stress protein [Mucilaginibacter boryungensis]MBE9668533.1 universal stress protein [Mucilaginibacter boryungensis]